jgi:hypothetical protein
MDQERPGLRTRLRPGWYRLLERSPRLYTAYRRRRQPQTPAVTAQSDVVVVGYPACANTFARIALLHANPGLMVASHAHSWTQVAEAVRHGLPTLVLVREPIGAVSSVLVRFSDRTPSQELDDYARLYRRTLPFLDQVVVADFGEVTSRFGDVIRRVNRRFGASFVPFAHDDPAATAAVLAEIEAYDRTQFGDATGIRTARPSREKEDEKARIRPLLAATEVQPLMRECDRLYRTLLRRAEG